MSITLDSKSTKRKVDEKNADPRTSVDQMEVLDQVGEVMSTEEEERERKELMEKERQLKERLLQEENKKKAASETPAEVDMDKVVIKKRSRRSESSQGKGDDKVLTVKTPDNLVAKLAQKLKELPQPAVVPKKKTDREKSALKKKIKDRYMAEKLPEKILYLALEKVTYDEARANILINKLIKDNNKKESGPVDEIVIDLDEQDKLDYEADDPEA